MSLRFRVAWTIAATLLLAQAVLAQVPEDGKIVLRAQFDKAEALDSLARELLTPIMDLEGTRSDYVNRDEREASLADLKRQFGVIKDRAKALCAPSEKEFDQLNHVTAELRQQVISSGHLAETPELHHHRTQHHRRRNLEVQRLEQGEERLQNLQPVVHRCRNVDVTLQEVAVRLRALRVDLDDIDGKDL